MSAGLEGQVIWSPGGVSISRPKEPKGLAGLEAGLGPREGLKAKETSRTIGAQESHLAQE